MKTKRENIFIEEKFDPGIKNALYGNFSRAVDAIKEIVDNSVSQRISGKKMELKIDFFKNKLSIADRGGRGMTIKNLEHFFQWGALKERSFQDIGAYGQGGKSAIGYLGSAMIITTSPIGENIAYRIEDWDLHNTKKLKKYSLMELPTESFEGYTTIEIENLRSNIREKEVKEDLINTYRPLITRGELEIFFNGGPVKVHQFPLDENFKIQKFSFNIFKNREIFGWIGRLGTRSGMRGGMRCYYKGRLMCSEEFFGHPDPRSKGTLNFLFGEVHLDYVPVVTNKTNFMRYSEEWTEVQKEMFSLLKPHINELLGREIIEPSEEEIKKIEETRDLFNEILKILKKEEEGLSGVGQKPRSLKKVQSPKSKGQKRGDYNPATPPPHNAVGKRKRLGEFPEWKLRPMDELTRSIIEGEKKERILLINNIFPAYITNINKGLQVYLLETACLQTVKPLEESLKPKEFLKAFDELFAQICNRLEEAKQKLKQKKR